jgi:hypothetical protein
MRRWVALGVALLLVAAVAVAVGLSVGGGDGGHPGPPAFRPAPGAYRLTPQLPGNGAPPQPQLLTNGPVRVLVAFGGTEQRDGRPVAGLALSLPGSTQRTAGRYGKGAVIRLGSARVTVLGVYDAPGTEADTVDLQVAAG